MGTKDGNLSGKKGFIRPHRLAIRDFLFINPKIPESKNPNPKMVGQWGPRMETYQVKKVLSDLVY
jgi:hypothetical protein